MNSRQRAILLERLEAKKTELAHAAMQFPKADLHAYGLLAGRYMGIEEAKDVVKQLFHDEDEDDAEGA